MFEFNKSNPDTCPACGGVHDTEDTVVKSVDIVEFDSEAFVDDMVALFAEHVRSEDELRAGLKRVYLTGYAHGLQSYLIEEVQQKMEELRTAHEMLFGQE